jgi:large subunit ribosomal protein L4
MKLPVLNIKGKETGKEVNLSDDIFKIAPNEHVVYLSVKQFLANQRQGTHKAKERADISGSTRKLKKQKGTGTARQGSIKSPLLRGGGRVFGPEPRDYGFKLNKKEKTLAKKSVLSQRLDEKNIHILEDFSIELPKTKTYMEMLVNLGVTDKKSLLVLDSSNKGIFKSANNLSKAEVATAGEVSVYNLLNSNKILITESGLKALEEILK